MKPVSAILESIAAPSLAAVRAAYAKMRELDVLVDKLAGKTQKLASDVQKAQATEARARGVQQQNRLELGRALIEARKNWPARGPRAKGWGEFLDAEGLPQRTAYDLMRLAGYVDISAQQELSAEIPTMAEVNAARRGPIEDQPDPPASSIAQHEDPRIEIVSSGRALDLRLGDFRTALADGGVVDAMITDAPFGDRTHASTPTRDDGSDPKGLTPQYRPWAAPDVEYFVDWAAPRCRGWMVALTSDDLIPHWKRCYERHDRFAFPPVPCVIIGMSHRMQGDGPDSWTVFAMVSRPRELARWGTTRGAYIGKRVEGASGGRGKPPWLMEQIVQDYTRQGDLVCDPLAGWGETLFAAQNLGRRAIGSELDAGARDEAIRRWRDVCTKCSGRGHTPRTCPKPDEEQP